MTHYFLFFSIQVILPSWIFIFQLKSKFLSIHSIVFIKPIFSLLLISSDPVKLIHSFQQIIVLTLSRLVFIHFSIGTCLANRIIDVSPSIYLLFINNDQSFSSSVGSCRSSGSVNISVTIHWNSHLNYMSNMKVKTSSCHISSDENITQFRFLEFLQFLQSLFLLHMRMKTDIFHSKGLDEKLYPFTAFYGIRKNDCFASYWQLFEITDDVCYSLSISFSKRDNFLQTLGKKQKRALVNYFWLVWKFGPRYQGF